MFSAFCAFCPSVAQLIYGTASAGMMSAAAFLPIPPPPSPRGRTRCLRGEDRVCRGGIPERSPSGEGAVQDWRAQADIERPAAAWRGKDGMTR